MDRDKLTNDLKELNDTEFEIVFVDKVNKKLKSIDQMDAKSPALLIAYLGILDTLRSYVNICAEIKRTVPHQDIVNLIISKGDKFLSSVANDESRYMYVTKSLQDIKEITTGLMLMLKNDLISDVKYSYLSEGCLYK